MLGKKLIQAAEASTKRYIEDRFSTWLYTGNSSTQTITNEINLSGHGGLVWIKGRDGVDGAQRHCLFDTERGVGLRISSNNGSVEGSDGLTGFTTSGFTLDSSTNVNGNARYAAWTFRKAPGFFDVVTFTGTGSVQTIAHNLKSVPGCIFIKRTDAIQNWAVYHRSIGSTKALSLNLAGNPTPSSTYFNDTDPTSTEFTVGTDASVNFPTGTYVAYLFAHDEQIFGDTGDESVIKCGSFTTNVYGNATVDLGWEPQWVLVKADGNSNWYIVDNMRGWFADWNNQILYSNLNDAESTSNSLGNPTSTGFYSTNLASSSDYIYIAIRRGMMKTPTDATEVFDVVTRTSTNPNLFTTALPYVDTAFNRTRASANTIVSARLTNGYLQTASTGSESSGSMEYDYNYKINPFYWSVSQPEVNWLFRRAPGFFDVVAYTGNGTTQAVSHNLGVAPELMLIKSRSSASQWIVFNGSFFGAGNNTGYGTLETVAPSSYSAALPWPWNGTLPGSGTFSVGDSSSVGSDYKVNQSGTTYIAYLFATLPGISKVGSYTGTGTTLNVDCGFTSGARFVLIKRTDSTGDWYVWDTARGIVSGNDPYLLLNSTAAEVTSTDYIDPYSAGFEISSTAPAAINTNGGTYIYLAIA